MTRAFISYSSEDSYFAEYIRIKLEIEGIEIWLDKDALHPSDDWTNGIEKGILSSDVLIVIMSPNSLNSQYMTFEWAYAFGKGIKVIPVLFRPTTIHPKLEPLHYIDFSQPRMQPWDELIKEIKQKSKSESQKTQKESFDIFDNSESPAFQHCIENLLKEATHVIMIGIGLSIIQRDSVAMKILEKATEKKFPLEIYLADPESPSIEMRLIEEELRDFKPPVGQSGLRIRLRVLIDFWKKLGQPDNIAIRLFMHYPTFALIIIDKEYFIYPYGYATVGNLSPVIHFSEMYEDNESIISYLKRQYKLIKESTVDALYLDEIRNHRFEKLKNLHPFALYLIPQENSALYEFGSNILGWDIRKREETKTNYIEYIGGAPEYGFHLTVCDSLYFATFPEAQFAKECARFLCKNFIPFYLTGLKIEFQFPDPESISILADDPSGSLEAIHHDLVFMIYRRAIASNYTLGKANLTRDKEFDRAQLMMKRYKAPYILQRYKPHFTLLTKVPLEKQEIICTELKEKLPKENIQVEKLAIMHRPNVYWEILEEIKIG